MLALPGAKVMTSLFGVRCEHRYLSVVVGLGMRLTMREENMVLNGLLIVLGLALICMLSCLVKVVCGCDILILMALQLVPWNR